MLSLAPHQVNEPLSMFSGDMMTVNVNLAGLPVRSTSPFFCWRHQYRIPVICMSISGNCSQRGTDQSWQQRTASWTAVHWKTFWVFMPCKNIRVFYSELSYTTLIGMQIYWKLLTYSSYARGIFWTPSGNSYDCNSLEINQILQSMYVYTYSPCTTSFYLFQSVSVQ